MLAKEPDFKTLQKEYDHLFKTDPIRDEESAYRWFAETIISEKKDAARILDIACGGGFFLSQLKSVMGEKVVLAGIDISTEALRLARKECPQSVHLNAVAECEPFKTESFDIISCLGSLEHFPDIPRALREMKRIAARNARIFILVPNIFWYKDIVSVLLRGDRVERNQIYERFASLGEWIRLIEECGLKVLKSVKYNGIAQKAWKQAIKDWVIPLRFSYHFLFICSAE
ncbi:MAG TPA: class I SAM-dependent methyltransferase [Candidatus Omnitrophota bacterium]|nr:class I SAM-dependent methyltransferase [Candidatus Omnitrophota bacterium]